MTTKAPMTAIELRDTAQRVQYAKFNLDATLEQLHQRLDPRTLASSAIENVREKGAEVAVGARRVASDRPYQLAAGVGVLSLVLAWPVFPRWRRTARANKDKNAGVVMTTDLAPPPSAREYGAGLQPQVLKGP